LLASCDQSSTPWIALREADGRRSSAPHVADERRWTVTLPAQSWELRQRSGTWASVLEHCSPFERLEEAVLTGGDRAWVEITSGQPMEALADAAPGSFLVRRNALFVRLPQGERPGELTLSFRRSRAADEPGRPTVGGFAGDGFALEPGASIAFDVEVPPRASLRFFLAHLGLEPGARLDLELRLDGERLASIDVPDCAPVSGSWQCVPLPPSGVTQAQLAFELASGAVSVAVLAPRIAALEPGAPERPDIVLFLADTFRADNLACYGSVAPHAPHLDAFARASLVFRDAWSTSTWTLPAQVSLLSGLHPEQHGAVHKDRALAPELVTLAERLAAQGYRTGAVTDSVYVSREFRFDQGFEWFHENTEWSLERTLADAADFLPQRDGRPAFLFVHTYRTHEPYRHGRDEARFDRDDASATTGRREQYQAGVEALDEQLGPWLDALVARDDAPIVVFTSDHGESLGEHGEKGHGGAPWEAKTRVPLLLHGPGIEPGVRSVPASLVDLPRTIAALAGVEPAPIWEGRDLLSARAGQAVFSFARLHDSPLVAVVEDGCKVIAEADPARIARGEYRIAFDLAADPHELAPLPADGERARRICIAHAERIAELLRCQASATARHSRSVDAMLQQLGY
jgi:arylsulfatase A-like enzyme